MKKWSEAVGLLDRALDHATQSLEQYRSMEQSGGMGAVRIDKDKVSTQFCLECMLPVGTALHVCAYIVRGYSRCVFELPVEMFMYYTNCAIVIV